MNRLLYPTKPLLLTSLVVHGGGGGSESLKIENLSASELSRLFVLVASPTTNFSSNVGCFTFVMSDWSCFESSSSTSPNSNQKQQQPFLSFNVIKRRKGDFAYNNHIYDALRNSFDLSTADVEACLKSSTEENERQHDIAEQINVDKVAEDDCDNHSDCSTLSNQLVKLTEANKKTNDIIVAECTKINISATKETHSDGSNGHQSQAFFYFFPFKNSIKNIAYENKHFFVIVNLKPVEKAGHLLVIPKKIVSNLRDCLFGNEKGDDEEVEIKTKGNSELAHDLGDAIKRSIDALNKRYELVSKSSQKGGCDGFSVVVQQGVCAGQTVGHLHVHVIALTRGEGLCAASLSSTGMVIDPDADERSAEELEEEERLMRKPRSAEEMTREAEELRNAYFV